MSLIDSFKKTVDFFEELRSEGLIEEYAMIGGLALSAWVRPRSTKDIDLVVAVSREIGWDDLVSLIETRLGKKVFVQKGTQRTNIKERLSYVSGPIEVDLISTKGFDLAAEAVRHAVVAEVFDKKIRIVIPEYLLLLKLLPLSDQDIVDVKALAAKADMHRVAALAKKYYLLPKLEAALGKKHRE